MQESDDATFAAGIEDKVDLDAFATYLPLHNLLLDPDDMGGKGQNYTLFYDLHDERFTVITWDMNEAFTDDANRGRDDQGEVATNLLKQRILALPGFADRYRREFAKEADALFAGGKAEDEIDRLGAVLAQVPEDVLPKRTIEAELDGLRRIVRTRAAAVAAGGARR